MNDKIELSLPGTPYRKSCCSPPPWPTAPRPPRPSRRCRKTPCRPHVCAAGPAGKKGQGEKPRSPTSPGAPGGYLTLGVALILTGLLHHRQLYNAGLDIVTVAKMAPLVLVALGLEILWVTARHGSNRLKYDFFEHVCVLYPDLRQPGRRLRAGVLEVLWA